MINRRGDAQLAAQRRVIVGQLRGGELDLPQQGHTLFIQGIAGVGQYNPPGRPVEQTRTELLLQSADILADLLHCRDGA